MDINFSRIHNLPVETESGIILGILKDLEFDVETNRLIHFVVKAGIFKKELLVAPEQVKKIDAAKIVVVDSLANIRIQEQILKTENAEA